MAELLTMNSYHNETQQWLQGAKGGSLVIMHRGIIQFVGRIFCLVDCCTGIQEAVLVLLSFFLISELV